MAGTEIALSHVDMKRLNALLEAACLPAARRPGATAHDPPPAPAEARRGLPALLTCAEVAEQLQLSERHVRRLMAAGALPVHRFGAAVRISRDDLARYIAGARHS